MPGPERPPRPPDLPGGRLALRVPPPLVATVLALAMLLAERLLPALSLSLPLSLPGRVALAMLLATAGIAVGVAALLAFRRARTTVNPLAPEATSTVVRGGIYAVSRNPMYLGVALLLAAFAVALGHLAAFAGPLLFVAWMNRFQVAAEERILGQRFGDDYRDYRTRVRRWL